MKTHHAYQYEIKKTLAFKVENGEVIVVADSKNGDLPEGYKQFKVTDPMKFFLDSNRGIEFFFYWVLQDNHKYQFGDNNVVFIDGLKYMVDDYNLKSTHSDHTCFIGGHSHEPHNVFNIYKDLLPFLISEQTYLTIKDKIKTLFDELKIKKSSIEITKVSNGFSIRASEYSSFIRNKYPNFDLFVSLDGQLEFLHFLYSEGEVYHNGEEVMSRLSIEYEIKHQEKLLEKYNELKKLFNRKLPL